MNRLNNAAGMVDEICHSATQGLCNTCGQLTDARIVFRGEQVVLQKWCLEHGQTEALICSDKAWYLSSGGFVKPGTEPRQRAVTEFNGCPDSCGLCPEHQQHTCVPIVEITDRCNLACPICLVRDRCEQELTVAQASAMFDRLVRYEGQINMVTLSGGEPTVHPHLLDIVDAARERREIGVVSVSTNGVALARDDDLLQALVDREVVISLQYDGHSADVYRILRGDPALAELKQRLIERVVELGGLLSLTVTLARGINEDQLSGVLERFFGHDQILSIMVHPLAYRPRQTPEIACDPSDIITIPDVVRLLSEQSGGRLVRSDFVPLPCSHPSCFALTYVLKTDDGKFVSLPRLIDLETYLDVIKNQALLSTDAENLGKIKDAIYALWSAQNAVPDQESVLRTVRQILLQMNRLGNDTPSPRDALSLGLRHVKSIFIHQFMDRATFDLSRAIKCCNHYPGADGRLQPVCVRNTITAPRATSGGAGRERTTTPDPPRG